MSKIAIIFNTDSLGGAERSLVLQLSLIKNQDFVFYIPKIKNDVSLEEFIHKNLSGRVDYFHFPKSIYHLSRTGTTSIIEIVKAFISAFFILFNLKSYLDLRDYEKIYLNGNKVALLFFLHQKFRKLNSRYIWHWRDYFSTNKLNDFIWSFLVGNLNGKLEIVCNSKSVQKNFQKSIFSEFQSRVIYNPSGLTPKLLKTKKIETIGFASMFAPWKGIHELILFAGINEKRLKSIGVKKISIYGDNLYETKGEHQSFKEELKLLLNKLDTDLIEFKGLSDPEKIFQEIDCLVHYSTKPEPFGRVIVEAFAYGVPVITTGLGGAGEIVDENINGLKTICYDREDLFKNIEKLNDSLTFNKLTLNAQNKLNEMEKEIIDQMQLLIG